MGGFDLLLPPGETVLWKGGPSLGAWLKRSWAIRAIWLWVGVAAVGLALWSSGGAGRQEVAWLVLVGAFGSLCVVAVDAWICRSTRYLITDRRIAMRFGLALPGTANIPLEDLRGASIRRFDDGSGDIAVEPQNPLGVGFSVLWPHVRPWRLSRPEPSLRFVPDVDRVGRILRGAAGLHD